MSNSEKPLVTVIVPSFNQGQYIGETLDSILAQDYRPLEIQVIDGGSEDGTVGILQNYASRYPEIHWLSEKDDGPADAVNKGLELAKGEICGIQSSDDIYLPGAIGEAVEAFLKHPEVAIVYGEGYPIDETGRKLKPAWRWAPYSYDGFLCGNTFILQSSAFFRAEAGRAVGGWRHDYFVADIDFWLRILHHNDALKVDRVWSAYRRHPAQRNIEKKKIFESYWQMIEDSVELQKAPLRYRLAADAGRRVFCQYYDPKNSRMFRVYQMWRALFTYPKAWHSIRNHAWLIPGLATFISRLKRTV